MDPTLVGAIAGLVVGVSIPGAFLLGQGRRQDPAAAIKATAETVRAATAEDLAELGARLSVTGSGRVPFCDIESGTYDKAACLATELCDHSAVGAGEATVACEAAVNVVISDVQRESCTAWADRYSVLFTSWDKALGVCLDGYRQRK